MKKLLLSIWLVLTFTTHLFAETCETNPGNCTPVQLCEKSTEVVADKTYWIGDETNSYLKVARQFGLDCGAIDALPTCKRDANTCAILELCEVATATKGSKTTWNLNFESHVKLAKSFGLNCEVSKAPDVEAVSTPTVLTPCDKNPAACISEMLCEKAAETSNGKVEWRSQTAPKYVAEAKKRKLDCQPKIIEPEKTKIVPEIKDKDIPAEIGTSNKQLENLFEKKDFQKLRIGERKQLQYGLKKLGYYKGAIDGLYGPMSQNAVRKYVQDKELLDGYPVSVLEALVAELGVGKYFTKPDKFSLTSYQIAKKPNTRLIPRTIDRTRAFIDVDGDGVDEVFEAITSTKPLKVQQKVTLLFIKLKMVFLPLKKI
ncbi:peptidoglycan-binding protein [Paracoccaceae bacterium]|nr:peptidoglycan-binding protein [Paracoccaceae bacterium]